LKGIVRGLRPLDQRDVERAGLSIQRAPLCFTTEYLLPPLQDAAAAAAAAGAANGVVVRRSRRTTAGLFDDGTAQPRVWNATYYKPPIPWTCTVTEPAPACVAKETEPVYAKRPLDIVHTNMDDSISLATWQNIGEATMILNEMFDGNTWGNLLSCYYSCLQPYTVVWVDGHLSEYLVTTVLPQLKVKIILLLGNDDDSNPRFKLTPDNVAIFRKTVAHAYIMNCRSPEL
jgi:hypothetical protein